MNDLVATGRFDIDLTPGEGLLPGTGRMDFVKTWSGEIDGTGAGVMLSAGDPAAGSAGYVALETFEGTVVGRRGTLVFQQFGTMSSGGPQLRYEVVPGSGTGDLAGLVGEIALDVDHGDHAVTLTLRSG